MRVVSQIRTDSDRTSCLSGLLTLLREVVCDLGHISGPGKEPVTLADEIDGKVTVENVRAAPEFAYQHTLHLLSFLDETFLDRTFNGFMYRDGRPS